MDAFQKLLKKLQSARTDVQSNMRDDPTGYGRFPNGDADEYDPEKMAAAANHDLPDHSQHAYADDRLAGPDKQDDESNTIREHPLRCLNKTSRRKMVLIIVFIALLLDNMLLTTVVPIIPTYLYEIEHPNSSFTTKSPVLTTKTAICKTRGCRTSTVTSNPQLLTSIAATERLPIEDDESDDEQRMTTTRTSNRKRKLLRHSELANENVEVGLMFASKSIMQMLVNSIIGPLTNRIGYTVPMFVGFSVMFLSTLIFAFGTSYNVLFAARAIQGVGSACSSVAGLGMLATYYPDDEERGRAISRALGGLALGVLVGPVFGGFMYEWVGKATTFLLLAFLALFDGTLQMLVLKPAIRPECQQGTPLRQLLADPYILIAAGSITFGNMGIAMLEPSLPLWMWVEMNAEEWQQGVAFLPCSISYLIGTNVFGPIAHRIGRWRSGGIGMLIISISLFFIPFAKSIGHLLVPNFCLGFAIGMVDASMMPLMGYLVDLRHVSVYGSVYAIADIAFCVGYAVGPLLAGAIVKVIGFQWMLWSISGLCLLYAPLHYFLRNPPGRKDDIALVMTVNCPADYVKACEEDMAEQDRASNGESYPSDEAQVAAISTQYKEWSNNPFVPLSPASAPLPTSSWTHYGHQES